MLQQGHAFFFNKPLTVDETMTRRITSNPTKASASVASRDEAETEGSEMDGVEILGGEKLGMEREGVVTGFFGFALGATFLGSSFLIVDFKGFGFWIGFFSGIG